ncbi:MAG: tetratricopeptide repeat protein [Alphaproteobacteria bacterium]
MSGFLKQLWARKVVQFGAVYLGAAWVLFQVAIAVESTLELPNWIDQATLVALGLGFPIALILAWAQESKVETVAVAPAPMNEDGSLKPTIAIMPFTNMSDDAEKEYFADGMTEDITSGLSLNPHLSVKSRTSTFAYKGQAVDIRQAARDLGVAYIVEGSIRPIGARIRISAQLIDAVSGDHLWSEKYDEPAEQLFDLQDEVINAITQTLGAQLTRVELKRARAKTTNLTSWEFIHARNPLFLVSDTQKTQRQHNEEVLSELGAMIKADPDYALLYACAAWNHATMQGLGWARDAEYDMAQAQINLERALALAPDDPFNLVYCAGTADALGRPLEAIELAERALKINPNYAEAYLFVAPPYAHVGQFDRAFQAIEKAREGGVGATLGPWLAWHEAVVRIFALLAGEDAVAAGNVPEPDIDKIVALLRDAAAGLPGWELPAIYLAASLVMTGQVEPARATLAKALTINPGVTLPDLARLIGGDEVENMGAKLLTDLLSPIWPKDIPAEEST